MPDPILKTKPQANLFTPAESEIETVTSLTRRIRKALTSQIGFVKVRGEISNVKLSAAGHIYFSLKDSQALIAAVLFRSTLSLHPSFPEEGTEIIASGQITVYEPRGQYQLVVEKIETIGQGDLQRRFEILKQKLLNEGLFDPSKKKPLPIFPKTIAIVTSHQGAVLHDLIQVFSRRAPGLHLIVYDTRVQGTEAPPEIVAAIQKANADAKADLIIIARGGGSLEDLWAFNEEIVVRAIAQSSLPTISAIGHETDFTLSDFAADIRAPTPSAAAEIAVRDWQEWRDEIQSLKTRLHRHLTHCLTLLSARLKRSTQSFVLRSPRQLLLPWLQSYQIATDRFQRASQEVLQKKRQTYLTLADKIHPRVIQTIFAQKKQHYHRLRAILEIYNVQATLKRGFTLIQSPDGTYILSRSQAQNKSSVTIHWHDGSAPARICD
ncbi:MAG: exodeoxyribonuclease VII large subunit [Methylacidiphilales bacterium]|nr:exodeoxyribonuclease VII large subunit [Candidatus Methylacidiphilales bacterium]MDW8350076.1 exodeoxyribonuclease VII large subunit [Verrucomicrobiae bacterium]